MAPLLFILGFCALLKGREDYLLTLLIVLLTNGLGMFGEVDFLIPSIKYLDLGLILLGCWFCVKVHLRKISLPPLSLFILFMVYLVVIISYDYFITRTSPINILKTYRHWSILLFLFFYRSIPHRYLVRCLKILLYLTLFFSIILIIEFVFGIQITNAGRVGFTTSGGEYMDRGAFGTTYNLLFILLLMTNFFKISRKRRIVYLSILCMVYINSMTRSTILVAAGSMFYLYWWMHNKSVKFLLKGAFVLSVAGVMVFSIPAINDRFFNESKGGMQIGEHENVGTLQFRLLLAEERLDYLLERPVKAAIGIGGIHETEFEKRQVFEIGLPNDNDNDMIVQLDTGDISWSVLFLRIGILGTILYIIGYLQLIKKIRKSKNPFSKAMVVYSVASIFFLSFVGGNITNAAFIIVPLLGLSIASRKHLEEEIIVHSLKNKKQ